MNRLVSMEQARELLALQGRSVLWVRRRLLAIAESRGTEGFQLFQLDNKRWFTTEADLRRVLPELFQHETGHDDLRAQVEGQARQIHALHAQLQKLEQVVSQRKAA